MTWFPCSGGSSGSTGHTYSTTEQKIGTWIDRSDLYEKTIDTGSFSAQSGTGHTLATDASISKLVEATGYIIESGVIYIIPEVSIRIKMDSSHNIIFYPESNWSVSSGAVTIRYTKISS